MNSEEFKEYYKNNKVVVFGVPIIVLMILANQFILKPARLGNKESDKGAKVSATVQTNAAQTAEPAVPEVFRLPPPITMAQFQPISQKLESRFDVANAFPYSATQNVFRHFRRRNQSVTLSPVNANFAENIVYKPDVSYHGFFIIGQDKVAILKSEKRLLLTRHGQELSSLPLVLREILFDRVLLADRNDLKKVYEIALTEDETSKEETTGSSDSGL